jgi:hypothetical protein
VSTYGWRLVSLGLSTFPEVFLQGATTASYTQNRGVPQALIRSVNEIYCAAGVVGNLVSLDVAN